MKNLTGLTLQWRGKTYKPEEEVPDDVAKEMYLATMPEQIKGQEGQQPPQEVTDPYDPKAIAAAQSITTPAVNYKVIPPVEESVPPATDQVDSDVLNLDLAKVEELPGNLKPEEEQQLEPETVHKRSRKQSGNAE
jgi:hypothetical protein